jgi:hypothetical protein
VHNEHSLNVASYYTTVCELLVGVLAAAAIAYYTCSVTAYVITMKLMKRTTDMQKIERLHTQT